MYKIVSASIVGLLICNSVWGQVALSTGDFVPTEVRYSGGQDQSSLKFTFHGFEFRDSKQEGAGQYSVTCWGCTPIMEAGAPDLGKYTTSIIVPDEGEMQITIIHSEFTEREIGMGDDVILPSKGNLYRNIDPLKVPFAKGTVYHENKYYPENIAVLRDPYIIRDYRGQVIEIFPIQYNPVTHMLRTYSEIEVEVSPTGNAGKNILQRSSRQIQPQQDFQNAYSRNFINYGDGKPYYPVLNDDRGNMLIISYGDFMDEIAPFVAWKKQKGIAVEVVDVATIGNASQIKTYVEGYYNTFGLTYLLLVGDAAQVPTFTGVYGDSDNEYGFITGLDFYPEIFVGRFSAENSNEVTVQVNRTLEYEKHPAPVGNWYSSGLCVGSNQGPGDDNEMDYEHERNIRTQLLDFTYNNIHELYDGSQGGMDSPGDPTPQMMFDVVQDGVGIINYTGHGSDFACSTTGFSVNEVNNLNNAGMYPFFLSVACVNGNFRNNTCFAETWLRAGSANPSQPYGAIATLMSTINQSWSPPMEGQDEMNAILTESYNSNVRHTFGGIAMNGCMKMNDSYGVSGYDMTETWTLFGDPSVVVRTAAPGEMTVNHAASITLGSADLTVNCDAEGALVSITVNGEILSTGIVSSGHVVLNFDPLASVDPLLVTVTAFNKMPYWGNVTVLPFTQIADPAEWAWEVWPNPFTSAFNVKLPASSGSGKVCLLNSLGQVLIEKESKGEFTLEFETSALPAGIYSIMASLNGETMSQRVVKCK